MGLRANHLICAWLRGLSKSSYILALLALSLTPVIAVSTGLHNSSRTFTPVSEMNRADWNDPVEMERVWQAALVRIPKPGGKYLATTIKELHAHNLRGDGKLPAVIYLHGCSGIWEGTHMRIDFLAANGYAVIAPPSMARKKYPKSCEPEQLQGGLYRGTLRIRQYDAGYAIEKAKSLPWVDADRIFLMGLSEGGITVATFRSNSGDASVRARVIEGWTCQAGWREYRGIKAPEGEPVLTLLGANDPWFQNPYTGGECTGFVKKRNDGSKSVVYTQEDLSHKHGLLEDARVRAEVLNFLHAHQ